MINFNQLFCAHDFSIIEEKEILPHDMSGIHCSGYLADRLLTTHIFVIYKCSKCKKIKESHFKN